MFLITVSSELGNSFRGKLVLLSPYYKLNVVKDITLPFPGNRKIETRNRQCQRTPRTEGLSDSKTTGELSKTFTGSIQKVLVIVSHHSDFLSFHFPFFFLFPSTSDSCLMSSIVDIP